MKWLLFSALSILLYAFCELFDKQGSEYEEKYSELKIFIWFGIASGIVSLCMRLLGLTEGEMTVFSLLRERPYALLSPVLYALCLVAAFLALKLIPMSIEVVFCNFDGLFTFVGVIIMYLAFGENALLDEEITPLKIILVLAAMVCVVVESVLENRSEDREENALRAEGRRLGRGGYFAVTGIILAVLSAVLDSASSLVDIYLLYDLSETNDYVCIHGYLTAMLGAVAYVLLWILEKKPYNPFKKQERPKALGAGFDSAGTVFYMLAVAENPIYSGGIISTYCVFSILFAAVFLKEKLRKSQKILITVTLLVVFCFTIADEFL